MIRIGDFSALSKISIYMLRNYDKLCLLVPEYVDVESGYRYYSERQLPVANRIQALKSMGLGLNTIKEILNKFKDNESLAGYLSEQVVNKRNELEVLQKQINTLETTITALQNNENILRYSIEVKHIPSRIVASIRSTINEYKNEGDLWKILADTLELQQIPIATLAYDMAIYHNENIDESAIDVELQRTVMKKGIDTKRVKYKDAKEILAAVLTYEGEYSQIAVMGGLITNWVKDNNYEFSGPNFNIYHISPATENNNEKMVTEVGFPIKKLVVQ